MTNKDGQKHRTELQQIARRVMVERGLDPDFSPVAIAELAAIRGPAAAKSPPARDLTGLLWCSIDNDDSLDLDQLSVAEELAGERVKVLVAIADVDALVRRGSAIDGHACNNTTSVYTAGGIFPMLPEKLSTDLTSLGPGSERSAIVVEMLFEADGAVSDSDIYSAVVRNQAKLAYNSVAAWLEGTGPMPQAIGSVAGLDANIRLQHETAERLRARRHAHGALSLQTIQARPVFDGEMLRDLLPDNGNVAKSLIEELMVAANGVTARYLGSRGFASIRRVVRTPNKWERIVELAGERGSSLPGKPDGRALEQFLVSELQRDPENFPDLSLCVIKLLGKGEYVVEFPGGDAGGHFGLAVGDYAHSTAPNRRFPDLLVQRLLKAALSRSSSPYPNAELLALAQHCTEQEDAAKKVERQVLKSAGAMLLSARIGERFDATVTGSSEKGTWVRIYQPPVEGKLVRGFERRNVGERLRVQLAFTDVGRGYIDFVSAA
jgi:VacB/RNase II family 3'-5' exoribonuclease